MCVQLSIDDINLAHGILSEAWSVFRSPAPLLETFRLRWKLKAGTGELSLDDLFFNAAPRLTSFLLNGPFQDSYRIPALRKGTTQGTAYPSSTL